MKKYMFLILAVIITVSYSSGMAFAAMSDESPQDETINTVVRARQRAKQEYEAYKVQQQQQAVKPLVQAPIKVAPKLDTAYTKTRNDIIIGVVLILVAISLGGMLYLSKKRE